MFLYHFTSAHHLRSISRYGLTVGDVPTDIVKGSGRIGVWLTEQPTADGHGIVSVLNKTAFRLTVEVPSGHGDLVRWTEWAPRHVAKATLEGLHRTGPQYKSWFVYFGVLPPASLIACTDMITGINVLNWGEVSPPEADVISVPPWRRTAWQKRMLKQSRRALG